MTAPEFNVEWLKDFKLRYSDTENVIDYPFDLGQAKGSIILHRPPARSLDVSRQAIEAAYEKVRRFVEETGYTVISS